MDKTRLQELAGVNLFETRLKPNTKVRIGHESKTETESDIPKRYRGRLGKIQKYVDQYPGEPPLYAIEVSGRKRPLILYVDEFTVITEQEEPKINSKVIEEKFETYNEDELITELESQFKNMLKFIPKNREQLKKELYKYVEAYKGIAQDIVDITNQLEKKGKV